MFQFRKPVIDSQGDILIIHSITLTAFNLSSRFYTLLHLSSAMWKPTIGLQLALSLERLSLVNAPPKHFKLFSIFYTSNMTKLAITWILPETFFTRLRRSSVYRVWTRLRVYWKTLGLATKNWRDRRCFICCFDYIIEIDVETNIQNWLSRESEKRDSDYCRNWI